MIERLTPERVESELKAAHKQELRLNVEIVGLRANLAREIEQRHAALARERALREALEHYASPDMWRDVSLNCDEDELAWRGVECPIALAQQALAANPAPGGEG